ncbi:MAG: HpsJ family protein [Pseudanabaenaceae cyanobacterium bins.39]|nr:HpsJ family protein [Pseudanabaenaceae cyanobacterium bins.39]
MSNSSTSTTENITANLVRFVGYGLLIMSISNFADALLPPRFGQDATWEFTALGKVSGSSPVTIIGLVLIFYGEATARSPFGKTILKILSWLSLVLSIFYVIMTLIGISASIRINNENNAQASLASTQQINQFNVAKENLKNTDDTNLQRVAEFIQQRSPNLQLNRSNPTELRAQLNAEIAKSEAQIKATLEESKNRAFRQLIKQSGKSLFESLVSAVILFGIWNQTKWTRTTVKQRKKKSSKSMADLADIASTPTLEQTPPSTDKDTD